MISILVFVVGICVGSFLNVAIFRVNESRSVIKGRSKCRIFEEPISAKDLIPVLSFFILRGKCRKCKNVISWQYPIVEFVTGILFLIFFLKFGQELFTLIRDWIFISFLIVIFVYDLKYMYILDRFTIPAMIVAIIFNLWLGAIPAESLITGAIVLGGFFYLQFVISNGAWVGGGDVRMGALMGLMLGLNQGLVALFLAYLLGAVIGVILLMMKRVKRKAPIAFGTFMAIGTAVIIFFGDAPLQWYLGLFV
ncbi:prepilin peptidase [Candidatus Uhrbacteria bacterium]|nr:prepilin peptidase [Candidatus Uhrbacteria bacterium]